MSKTQGGFKLKVTEGEFTDSQIIVMLGENGTGKTTFIRMLVCVLILTVGERLAVVNHTKSDPFTLDYLCRLVY